MTPDRVSVVVVSRGRPAALALCITALAQQRHPEFEVVVVADPEGLAALARWQGRIRCLGFDESNISAARNLGVTAAAGAVVAFLDDDAVPEPTWLARLTAPFADPDVAASGGYVRGRNGIAFQWRARAAFADGSGRDLVLEDDAPIVLRGRLGRGVKTEGTNMAVRRSVLARLGGFDPAYRFYLDETDLNLRLASFGARTAIVPLAQVQHGYLESPRRRADRVPRDLHEIGASLAVFLRRHGARVDGNARIAQEREAQRWRLTWHMVAGRIAPGDVDRLLSGFDAGVSDGRARVLTRLAPLGDPPPSFLPFRSGTPALPHVALTARPLTARARMAEAAALAERGHVVSLCILSPTALRHAERFDPAGVWVQRGGLFGRSDPADPPFRWWRRSDRFDRERARIRAVRDPQEP